MPQLLSLEEIENAVETWSTENQNKMVKLDGNFHTRALINLVTGVQTPVPEEDNTNESFNGGDIFSESTTLQEICVDDVTHYICWRQSNSLI